MSIDALFTLRRMYRIFRDDGRSLIVAMDHGSGLDVYPALVDPARVLDAVIAGGADAILTTPGILKRFASRLKSAGVILRVDGGNTQLGENAGAYRLLYSVEEALQWGADAVACMGFPGSPFEQETLENLAALAGQCHTWGVPVMAEMVPGGFSNVHLYTPENIRLAVRVGIELGADFVKTAYTGSKESFRSVIEHAYRPVLVLGGGKVDDARAFFTMVREALDAGAAGVAVGRNIWGHEHPRAMVAALNSLIHEKAAPDEALDILANESPR